MEGNNNIFFSIIIPTYNRENFIAKTIQSALNQSYHNLEIIIVDDGSTDNTEMVVKNIRSENIFYYRIKNSERGAARNFGTKKAKGDYITFIDSDDLIYKDYLLNAAETLIIEQFPPFFHLAYEIKNNGGKTLFKINNLQSDNIKFITKGNPLSCMGIFLRKDVSEQFTFNEDRRLSGSEDWELWLRVIANFGIKTDNRISACLIQHDGRSVMQINEQALYERKELALKYAFQDKVVREKFSSQYNKIDAFADTYIALHLTLAKKNKKGLIYLVKAARTYPLALFTKRVVAILKHVILNLLN